MTDMAREYILVKSKKKKEVMNSDVIFILAILPARLILCLRQAKKHFRESLN